MQDTIVGFGVVNQRIILRSVKELVCDGIFLITVALELVLVPTSIKWNGSVNVHPLLARRHLADLIIIDALKA
jgi:hypothetical protein